MPSGILVTAALTCIAGLLFGLAADRVRLHRRDRGHDAGTVFLFFVFLAAMLMTAGLREAAAWAALENNAWTVVDRFLFYVAAILAAYAIVPLAQLVGHVAVGPKLSSWVVTYAFSALATVGVAFLFVGGVAGPEVDAWGSDWHILSPVVIILVITVAVLPGLWAMWALSRHARHLNQHDARRVQCVAGACALYVSVLALGAIGVPGAWVLVERGAYLVASWSAWSAYAKHPHDRVSAVPWKA